MKIKIGDKIHNADEEFVMLILTDKDKENIANMAPHMTKYCAGPDTSLEEEMREFMKVDDV